MDDLNDALARLYGRILLRKQDARRVRRVIEGVKAIVRTLQKEGLEKPREEFTYYMDSTEIVVYWRFDAGSTPMHIAFKSEVLEIFHCRVTHKYSPANTANYAEVVEYLKARKQLE